METDRDLIIIGGGAAGLTAAQYGARGNLSVLVIEQMAAGGQALLIDDLENYPGFPEPVKGFDISQKMEQQAVKFGAEITYASVASVKKEGNVFVVKTDRDELKALSVIIATGSQHRNLNVPGEKEFTGRGVSYCATCDGPFFKDKKILVVGGGDAACDEATYLSNLTDKIIMIHRRDRFRAQKALAERVLNNPHIEVRFNHELKEIMGSQKVEKVRLLNNRENNEYEEDTDAVFIFIGSIPQTAMIQDVKLDEAGYIVTDRKMETNIRGLFAAGDVRSTPFRQVVVAAGEGAVAAHSVSQYIDELRGEAYK
ncbi:MAG: thioredoxin-disulfide reductase [Spirochaetes bacterium]|nr:thioredoxin-disulfide reductase [Spirochaetota bacterium]